MTRGRPLPPWRVAVAGAAVLSLGLSGCVMGPNFTRPAAPDAQGYGMAGDAPPPARVLIGATAAGPWWRTFASTDLDRTVEQALENNPDLASAAAALSEARAADAAERGGLYPELDATAGLQAERINLASFGFSSFPGEPNNPTFDLYSVGLSASYLVPVFGLTKRQVEGADARKEAKLRQAEAAALALTGQVASKAAEMAAISAEIELDQAVIAEDHRALDLSRAAEQAGGEGLGRRVGAQSQLASDEALLPPLRQSLAAARHALALLVGKAPANWTAPDFQLDAFKVPERLPLALPSELVRRRPDILAAEAELHAATADVGVATAKLYPQLTLTGSLAQNSLTADKIFDFPSTSYALGLGLTEPVFDGGRLRAQRNAAAARRRAALAAYEMTVLRAFTQVSDLLQALDHDDESIRAETAAASAAQADVRLAEAGYKAGGLGLLPLIDAQRTSALARRGLIQAQARRVTDVIQLFIASGADWTQVAQAAKPRKAA